MTNILDGNASLSLSSVVAFKGRDPILPKGIDGGEMLAWASAEELLAYHLELAADPKAFWKDGFLLYALCAMSDFCGMVPPGGCSRFYPYTRAGFISSSVITARRSALRWSAAALRSSERTTGSK